MTDHGGDEGYTSGGNYTTGVFNYRDHQDDTESETSGEDTKSEDNPNKYLVTDHGGDEGYTSGGNYTTGVFNYSNPSNLNPEGFNSEDSKSDDSKSDDSKSEDNPNKYLVTDGGYTSGEGESKDPSEVPDLTSGEGKTGGDTVQQPESTGPGTAPEKKGHRAFLIGQVGSEYAGETGGLKGDQLAALQDFAALIKEVKGALAELNSGVTPGKVAAKLKTPGLGPKLKSFGKDGIEDAKAFIQEVLDRSLTKARLQDIPINDDGSLGDVSDRKVKYDTEEEQKQSTVTPTAGKLHRAGGEPVDTSESSTYFSGKGVEIFVVSNSGEIHMASHKLGKYHHSSLLAGSEVAMGGEMKVTGGKIDWITNKSGHYRPTKDHLVQFLHWMQKDGIDLGFEVKQGWGVPGGKTAADFLQGIDSSGRQAPGNKYHDIKLKAVLKSYQESEDDDDFDEFFEERGWWKNFEGTVEDDKTNEPIDPKVVIKALKEKFGATHAQTAID